MKEERSEEDRKMANLFQRKIVWLISLKELRLKVGFTVVLTIYSGTYFDVAIQQMESTPLCNQCHLAFHLITREVRIRVVVGFYVFARRPKV